MKALEKLGLLNWIGNIVESAILAVPEKYQFTSAIVLIVWVSGIASAFIDNIPFTTMMIPVVTNLSQSPDLNMPLQPLVWSLALGACLGMLGYHIYGKVLIYMAHWPFNYTCQKNSVRNKTLNFSDAMKYFFLE